MGSLGSVDEPLEPSSNSKSDTSLENFNHKNITAQSTDMRKAIIAAVSGFSPTSLTLQEEAPPDEFDGYNNGEVSNIEFNSQEENDCDDEPELPDEFNYNYPVGE